LQQFHDSPLYLGYILQRASALLKKAELLAVAHYLSGESSAAFISAVPVAANQRSNSNDAKWLPKLRFEHWGVSEKTSLEGRVPLVGDGHKFRKLWFVPDIAEQWIAHEVRPGKESVLNAVAQHPKGRSRVSQDCVRFSNLIGSFRISHSA
jgi:hypothetical protein